MLAAVLYLFLLTSINLCLLMLEWASIDFHQELPDSGYDPLPITITNVSNNDIVITIRNLDEERLKLTGFLDLSSPPTLPPMSPSSSASISLGVISYVPGELESTIEGAFTIDPGDGLESIDIPWSYTPIRNIPTDTGLP